MEVTDENINLTYQGVEIGERGEILNEVVNILGEKGERGVKEIQEALRDIDIEVGINTLRDILKGAIGKELSENRGLKGKSLYRINPSASQLHGYIRGCEAVKQKPANVSSLMDTPPHYGE